MSPMLWQDDDSPLEHGEPISPVQALVFGVALVVVVLVLTVPGCAGFVVAVAS